MMGLEMERRLRTLRNDGWMGSGGFVVRSSRRLLRRRLPRDRWVK